MSQQSDTAPNIEPGPMFFTARMIAELMGCSIRTARKKMRRHGSGVTMFGAERWAEPLVLEMLLDDIRGNDDEGPRDQG